MGSIERQTYFKPKPYIPKITKHEESVQLKVAAYLRDEYDIDFHSDYAAGLKLSKWQATVRRRLNSGRGWSDMFIPYPSRDFHGLFLELKKEGTAIYVSRGPRKGKLVQDDQIIIEAAFLQRMNKLGYFGRFAVGLEGAKKIIDWYMDRPQNTELQF